MTRLLIVDDEPTVLYSLQKCLSALPLEIIVCSNGRDAVHKAQLLRPDMVLLDVCLPDMSGLEVYDALRETLPGAPVIIITAFSTTDTAIQAMKRGAFEYLVKPVDVQRLREVVSRAAQTSQHQNDAIPAIELPPVGADGAADGMVGMSPAMHEVYKSIGRVASQDVTTLILGESGTGKEVAARTIWKYSHRASQPFIAINCAAIPEALLESELFGYEKGAFTGAVERRVGKFEHANGGTVFLDEIGDMTSATQAKVLRIIQEQSFQRIGGTQSVNTDVRILAATNKNLSQMAAEGAFRQDLYYRINGFTITLPPLRERQGDIPHLTHHFIARFNRELGKAVRAITSEAMEWLEAQPWPGNVRQLQNSIKYAMIKAVGDVLTPDCFPPDEAAPIVEGLANTKVEGFPALVSYARQLLENNPGDVYRQLSATFDNVVLDVAMRYAKGNQLQAAALLGISRTTLRAKLRSLGLTVEKQLAVDPEPIDGRCPVET